MRSLAPALAALLLAAGLSGCTDGTPSDKPAPAPRPTGQSSTAAAACQDHGFVPRTRIKVDRTRDEILYVRTSGLGPGGTSRGPGRLSLLPPLHLGVRLASPDGVRVPDAVRQRVATALTDYSVEPLPQSQRAQWHVDNTGRTNRSYLIFRAGRVARGTWTSTACGAPVNDGSRVVTMRGSWRSVRVLPEVHVTGCRLHYDTALERQGASLACH